MTTGGRTPWWSPRRWWRGRGASLGLPPADRATAQEAARAAALSLGAAGRLDEAAEVLNRAIADHPANKGLYDLLGAVHFKRGEGAQAIIVLERGAALAPDHAYTQNLLGMCHMLSGDEQAALPHFLRAIEIDPRFAEAQANAGWLSVAMAGSHPGGGHFRNWLALILPGRGDPVPPAPNRLSLPRVTLVCVDCAYHEIALYALRKSIAQCDFGAVYFFTDRPFDVEGIEVVPIARIGSMAEYSNFLIHQLGRHIQTDFALVIQYDGFVLNPGAWNPDLLDYDYAGATIPTEQGGLVGNGGFSLRSKKLLTALADPLIAAYDAHTASWQEDMAICVQFRERLERVHGVRIAPVALADQFSVEFSRPHAGAFGFHGLLNLIHLAEKDFRDLEPPGTRRIAITLRASTPLGMLVIANSIETLSHPGFGREVVRQAGSPAQ